MTRYCRFAADAQGTTAGSETGDVSGRLTITCRQNSRCVFPKQALVLDGPGASFLRSLDINRVDTTVPLPVEPRPHMPMLIHSCTYMLPMQRTPVKGKLTGVFDSY